MSFVHGKPKMSESLDRPYPRFCPECGKESVVSKRIPYNAKQKHDGKVHQFYVDDLPIEQCENCNEQWFTSTTDDVIQAGLRTHLCTLHPHEIRQRLKELNLSQAEFANRIGVAAETVSRWLNSHAIQNKAMDNLMRLFLGLEIVRSVLSENGPTEGLGVVRTGLHDLSWVQSKDFSVQAKKRRDSFQLRVQVEEAYVR